MSNHREGSKPGTELAVTAAIAAAGRSVENYRQDGLISDPYAEALVEATQPARPIPTRPAAATGDTTWRALSDLLGVRSRYFDDVLSRATADGIRQVVLLASGLDTRSHRLGWLPGTTLFEIDRAPVLALKQRVLHELGAIATCEHRPVPHDLRSDWSAALRAEGLSDDEPTVWIAEGLLYYLTPQAQGALLQTVDTLSAPGSRWAIEDDPNFLRRMATDPDARTKAAAIGLDLQSLLEAGTRPDPGSYLRDHNWSVESRTLRAAAASYGRALDPLAERINGPFLLIESRKV